MIKRTLLILLVAVAGCAGAGELDVDEPEATAVTEVAGSEDVEAAVQESTSDKTCWYSQNHCSATTCWYECEYRICYPSGYCAWVSEIGCYPCDPVDGRDPRDPPPYET